MKNLVCISALLLLGTYGYDVSKAQGQSQLKSKHITRACTMVYSTPAFLSQQKFAEEMYKLEDLAGRDTYLDGEEIEHLYKIINLLGSYNWTKECEKELKREFRIYR